jgi:PAS domain S-box-containing protein
MVPKVTILIVDDEPLVCDSLKNALSDQAYDIHTVTSGQEALDRFQSHKTDIVLLDVVMPDMDGFQVMDRIQRHYPGTMVIIITGHASIDSAIEALKKGAYGYVRKPVEREELVATIKNASERLGLENEKMQAEDALRRAHNELEKRVEERTADLIKANQRLLEEVEERKQAEMALEQSERRYCSLVENSPDIIYLLDPEGYFNFVGGAVESMTGFGSADLLGHHYSSLLWPEDIEKAKWRFNERRTGARATKRFETRLKINKDKKNGNGADFLPIEIHAFGFYDKPVSSEYKEFVGTYGVGRDISERKKAEKQIREKTRLNQMLLDALPCVALLLNKDNEVVFSNEAGEKAGAISGEPCFITWRKRSDPCPWCLAPEAMDTGQAQHLEVEVSGVIWDLHWVPVDQDLYLHYGFDVTEKRSLELQFQQAQKMEALGTLAGGIAHDFNNLLMGIQGNTSLMLLEVDPDNVSKERLDNIEKYVKNGAELTKQLLGFARGARYEVKFSNLNLIVSESAQMFGRTKKEIMIHESYEEDVWTSEVDPGQIKQVLLNLYINAWQAMPSGGALSVSTKNMILDHTFVRGHDVKPGKFVKISVSDTGVGMDKATQQRIFEPFFTTKEVGCGTGLGLASAYGIVKNHGGIIEAESQKGHGTTFNIYLPAIAPPPE